jgi:hypothetical protein
VLVEHHERTVGRSNYALPQMLELLTRILFNYSAFPLRLLAASGVIVAGFSFCFAAYVLTKALLGGTTVPGWASVVVLLTFFNGVTLLILGIIGEYLIRMLTQTSMTEPYHIVEAARQDDE